MRPSSWVSTSSTVRPEKRRGPLFRDTEPSDAASRPPPPPPKGPVPSNQMSLYFTTWLVMCSRASSAQAGRW